MWRFLRIHKDQVLLLSAVGLALCVGLAALGYWYFAAATKLGVAVGPADSLEDRLMRAYAEALAERRRDLRLRIVGFDNVKASAEALQAGKVDLAVVRPDVLLPSNGATVAILREEALIVLAPAGAKISDMAGLAHKKLGFVSHHEADLPILSTILTHYDLAPPSLTLVALTAAEVEEAFAAKRIDALAFFAAPVSRTAEALARAALKASGDKLAVVGVEESEALALKTPALTAATIPPGSLVGRPKQPGDEVKTVAVSYRLMTRTDADRVVISKVAQYLFQMRSRIAQAAPSINLMKAPDNETVTSAALPNHPGAVDYFNREQLSFMDRYGDWLWLALFAAGGVSSGFAWVTQLFARKRRELVDQVLDRVLCILTEARAAKTVAALDDLALELDGLITHAVRHARRRKTGTRVMSALMLAIDAAREAIIDQRRDMLDERLASARSKEAGAPRLAARRSSAR